MIEIKNRWTGNVMHRYNADDKTLRGFVEELARAGANLTRADLTRADLRGADLTRADLTRAYLAGANLTGANLAGANLTGANLNGADLAGANLTGADLAGANLTRAYLAGANLAGANLAGANLSGADLSGADLARADLGEANLSGADLRGADLRGVNLAGAYLTGANLARADLPAPTMLLLASWGDVTPDLCADLMHFDASNHPNPALFDAWSKGGACPYADVKVGRAAWFHERRELWGKGQICRPYDLAMRVLAEKCPDWSPEVRVEFEARFKKNSNVAEKR